MRPCERERERERERESERERERLRDRQTKRKTEAESTTYHKCNGVEWSKDKTQAAESIKWRPQQAYGSNQFLLVQPQTVFSTHQNPHAHA